MAKKFEIVNNALQITDTITTEVLLYLPARDAWFNENKLDNDIVSIYGVNGHAERKDFDLSECTDSNDVSFTKDTFRTFASTNLGKSSGGSTPSTTGWAQYSDGTYNSGNTLSIAQGVETTLTNDASSVIDGFLPSGVTSFWDSSTNRITPEISGDAYLLRVTFKAFTSSNTGYAVLKLNIGGAQGVILERGFSFPRGTGIGNVRSFSSSSLIYSLGTFVANGGELLVESVRGITEIYDISFVIDRVHKEV